MLELVDRGWAPTARPSSLLHPHSRPTAITGDPDLVTTLEVIAELVGADAAALYAVSKAGELGTCLAAVAPSAERADGAADPALRPPRLVSGQAEGWLPGGPAGAPAYLTILQPRARERIALVCRPGGGQTRPEFERSIARSLPLIERAIAHWVRADMAGKHLREEHATFDNFGFGFLVIDVDCRIQMANSAARAIMAQSGAIASVGDRLTVLNLEDAMRFQISLRHVLGGTGSAGEPVMIALRRPAGTPLLLAIRAVRTPGEEPRFVTVQINDPAAELMLPIEALSRHYDLTPAERRLVEQLVGGRTLCEAATMLRLKEHTARTYLKHIFQKTGFRRQVDLVRMVLSGTVPRPRANA